MATNQAFTKLSSTQNPNHKNTNEPQWPPNSRSPQSCYLMTENHETNLGHRPIKHFRSGSHQGRTFREKKIARRSTPEVELALLYGVEEVRALPDQVRGQPHHLRSLGEASSSSTAATSPPPLPPPPPRTLLLRRKEGSECAGRSRSSSSWGFWQQQWREQGQRAPICFCALGF